MHALKKASKTLIAIVLPLIMLLVIFIGVELFSGDRAWLKREYTKLGINDYTGMSTDDMIAAFMQMVGYMKGSEETMDVLVSVNGERVQMYNESERAHMVDVRSLYKTLTIAKYAVIALAVAALVAAAVSHRTKSERREVLSFAAKAALWSIFGVVAFLLALGAWALIDFDSFWSVFHIVFLDLESSTFDPAVSRMIRICPAELFLDMVIRIFAFACAVMAAIAAAALVYLKKSKRSLADQPSIKL